MSKKVTKRVKLKDKDVSAKKAKKVKAGFSWGATQGLNFVKIDYAKPSASINFSKD